MENPRQMNNCVGRMNGKSDPSADEAPNHRATTRAIVAVARLSAVATLAPVLLLADSFDHWSDPPRVATVSLLWAIWGTVLLTVLVPSSVSLTAMRLLVPSIVGVAVLRILDGGEQEVWIALALALLATVLAAAAEVGEHFVQLSAYGDERRFPLRCPPPMLAVLLVSWAVWFVSVAAALHFWLASGRTGADTAAGIACSVVAIAASVALPRRFHRFSRRWLVYVPAGLVVHDHVALAETAMFSSADVVRVEPTNRTDEADLSAGCRRTGVAIELSDFDTVVKAATPSTPGGSAVHVRTMWVCPSRPGRAASAWAARSPHR